MTSQFLLVATIVAHLSLSVWAAGGPTKRRKQKAEPLAISPGLAIKVDEEDISSGPNAGRHCLHEHITELG